MVNCNFPNNIEVTFESDENDFDAGFVLESDEDTNAGSENLPQLESALVNIDKNVRAVDNELPISRKNVILPGDFDNDVVLESEEEELAENTLFLSHLGRISNDISLYCHDDLAPSAF